MKKVTIFIFTGLLFFTLGLSGFVMAGTCPIQPDTDIVVYVETDRGGVWDVNVTWFETFLNWLKTYNPSLTYVELSAANITNDCYLSSYPNLKLYIQPGGNAYNMQKTLRRAGKNNIVAYINNGGAYLGVCAGFYYAAADYYWQNDYYDWRYLLGLYPTVEGSIVEIQDYDVPPGYTITGITDNVDGQNLSMVYYGGPTRGYVYTPSTFPGTKVLTFNTQANGNSLLAGVMDGKKLLLTVHPEAVEDIYITGLTHDERIENYKWLANRINEAAGTSYYVPPYTPAVTQCSDGIDNDGDGFIDFPNDLGCGSADDDDEIDPGVGCSDGFESGDMSGWSLYGTGKPWEASTDNSHDGSYAARAKATGAGDDSFMEWDVTGCGTTLTYYRKLIGLDAVDDFEVSYYDNGAWTMVEHLGSDTANDSGFIMKSFSIPSTTKKIRFKCQCGAVSEQCIVDDVSIE